MRRSGVRASAGESILASMFALFDICVFRSVYTSSSGTGGQRVVLISQYRQRNTKVGSSSLPWSKYFSRNVYLVRYLCVPLSLYQLHWHRRLARRTYKSVKTEKCEGREFEPPLEQIILPQCLPCQIFVCSVNFIPAPVAQSVSASYL